MSHMVKIRHGVPLPDAYARWPFAKMQVGDSFVAGKSESHGELVTLAARIRSLAWKFSKRHGGRMKFPVHVVGDEVHCWRTK